MAQSIKLQEINIAVLIFFAKRSMPFLFARKRTYSSHQNFLSEQEETFLAGLPLSSDEYAGRP
jgi:hypothetical protein